ncbi:hypothetical protein U9M48_002484, partial [Paspalum notatum var. saurae]
MKPVSYISRQGFGLINPFTSLLPRGNLDEILDPQVSKEGDGEVVDVALLAAMCVKSKGEERPTMRQVEMTLESIQASKEFTSDVTDDDVSSEGWIRGCNATCRGVDMPYLLAISVNCSLPGFNDLICEGAHNPPRLLLGHGGSAFTQLLLHVTKIHLHNATDGAILNQTFKRAQMTNAERLILLGNRDPAGPFILWYHNNGFVVLGCNLQQDKLLIGNDSRRLLTTGGCSTFCTLDKLQRKQIVWESTEGHHRCGRCSGGNGCCRQAKIQRYFQWYDVELQRLLDRHHQDDDVDQLQVTQNLVLIAEKWRRDGSKGLIWCSSMVREAHVSGLKGIRPDLSVPIVLEFAADSASESSHSSCIYIKTSSRRSYEGNAYLVDGSQGLAIGQGVGSVATLLILALSTIFVVCKVKEGRKKKIRQRFFEQNRGQLLQQLVCQKADIGEQMIITLQVLEKATNNFDKSHELGGGGHGMVYKGILSSQHVVAIKKANIVIQKEINEFINEVNHRNIVKLLGCCLETEVPLLVYEFISNGTLYKHLHVQAPRSISWKDRLRIAIEAARALSYLHSFVSTPIVHRDIKSPNILLDDNLAVKLSDFGASRNIRIDQEGIHTSVQGTLGYLDPMYYNTGHLTEKSDEGDGEVVDVALLAAMCVKSRWEERPAIRQVEIILESIQASNDDIS